MMMMKLFSGLQKKEKDLDFNFARNLTLTESRNLANAFFKNQLYNTILKF